MLLLGGFMEHLPTQYVNSGETEILLELWYSINCSNGQIRINEASA